MFIEEDPVPSTDSQMRFAACFSSTGEANKGRYFVRYWLQIQTS
jgi:hypothetical protein